MAYQEEQQKIGQNGLFPYDPIIILKDVLRHWPLIIMTAILAGMITFVGAELTYRPQYTTNTTFVVSSRGNSTTVFQNLDAASQLTTVFSKVINSSLMREKILAEVGIEQFNGRIDAQTIESTNLLTMRVTDGDPRVAFLVTKAVVDYHDIVTKQVMGDTVLEVLQKPTVPTVPSNPLHAHKKMELTIVATAMIVSVLLAVASIFKDTVRSKDEAENKLGEYVLGEIVHEKKYHNFREKLKHPKTSILITNPTTSFVFVEQIRKLRRRIEANMPENGKVLMVTSLLENEGKSTIAVNLALSMAQKKRVLLIDGDLHKPACYKILEQGKDGAGSLSDVLLGKETLERAICTCNRFKKLSMLLEWGEDSNGTDIINSDSTRHMLKKAKEQYDFIIVDVPPMSAAVDAECLAELADATILVMRQNQAKAALINEGLDILHASQTKVLGCVLNNVCRPVFSEMGHYGYGRGYGYGYGYDYKNHYYSGYSHYGKYRRGNEPEEK